MAQDMASAIGAADCWELDDDADVQRIAANTIDAYMAKIVVHRTYTLHIQAAGRPTTEEIGSVALAAVFYTPPSPLLTVGNETSRTLHFVRGLALDAATLHDTPGHVSADVLRATCRE